MKFKKTMIAILAGMLINTVVSAGDIESVSLNLEAENQESEIITVENESEDKFATGDEDETDAADGNTEIEELTGSADSVSDEKNEMSDELEKAAENYETATEEEKPVNELLYSESSTLSEGLEYTRNLYYHPSYGNQREYILEYTPSEITNLHFSGNEYLYRTSYVKDIAAFNHPDENFVAGINGDFFNMSTGVPESAVIKGYELYTTDRDSFCLALTDEGEYFFDKPSVKLELVAEDETVINVAHLNKEFSEYALYLYNSNYSTTTHIKNNYSEAVLMPYDDVLTTEELIVQFDTEAYNLDEVYEGLGEEDDKTELLALLEEVSGYTYIEDMFYRISGVFPSIGYSEKLVVTQINKNCKNSEIPYNSYLLCGDNTSYGYIVDGMNPGDTFELKISGNEKFVNAIDAIGVGVMIVNDSEVIDNTSHSIYTSLQPRSAVGIKEDGTLVFYAVDGRQKNKSAGLKLIDLANVMKSLGCTYAANLDGGGSTLVSASRPGFDTAETVNYPSGNTERRISNAFIFTNTLEKTENAHSVHYYDDSIITFSDWFIELPEPIISDENGFEFLPDEDDKPDIIYSVENENSIISDGKLYINGETGKTDVTASVNGVAQDTPVFSVYSVEAPDRIELSVDKTELAPYETAAVKADAFYRNLPVISGFESFVWSVKASEEEFATGTFGKVENGEFTPFRKGEEYTITASKGETSDSITVYVDAYPFEDIENHWAVKEIYKLAKDGVVNGYPGEETDLFYYMPQRSYSRYEFIVMLARMTGIGSDIEAPVKNPDENANAVIVSEEITETDMENVSEENLESETKDAEAVSEAIQNESDDDTSDENTDALSEEIDEQEKVEDDEFIIPDFADWNDVPDWAYDAVYRLYVSGFLDGIMQTDEEGNTVLNGNDFITRADVMTVMGMLCEEAPEEHTTVEYTDLSDEQKSNEYIRNVTYAGIFSGYEDMTLRPLGFLTRAEAATVFVRLEKYLSETEF